jgi:Flp pilus assembly protein TadG
MIRGTQMTKSLISRSGLRGWRGGQSMTELAIVIPVLALVLVIIADFARMFYLSVEVSDAARAGAQYASQSVVTAADTSGITTAADYGAPDVGSLSVSSNFCTCVSPTPSGQTACATSYCTDSPDANYVEVDASASFTTLLHYPGVPNHISVPGKAIMQVQE